MASVTEQDHTLADCQQITAGLREWLHDGVPVEAVAAWTDRQRAEVAGWLQQMAEDSTEPAADPPDWLKRQHQLHQALCPNDGAAEVWQGLQAEGAADGVLQSQVATVLALQDAEAVGTDYGPVCWRIGPTRKPAIWFDRDEPPARGKADLAGRSLIAAVRRLYGVGLPPAPEGDQPAAAAGEPRQQAEGAAQRDAVDRVAVPLDQVAPSPYQPRETFDADKLSKLAGSLKRNGQLSDCLARRLPDGTVELIGGERRLRAARLAGLDTLSCRLITADDATARQLAVADNLDRVDLKPLERVRAYQALLDAGVYPTQRAAAAGLGLKPASLSNLLRTLKLPEEFLQVIDRGLLPLTHARYLLPFLDQPAVLTAVARMQGWPASDRGVPAVGHWQSQLDGVAGHIAAADAARKDRNAEQTRKFLAEAEQPDGPPAGDDPAEGDQLQQAVREYRSGWLQQTAAGNVESLQPDDAGHTVLQAVLLWLLGNASAVPTMDRPRLLELLGLPTTATAKRERQALRKATGFQLFQALRAAVRDCLADGDLEPPEAEAVAELLGINLARLWRPDREFLDLHTFEQLDQLRRKWRLPETTTWQLATTKTERVAALLVQVDMGRKPAVPAMLKQRAE